jgi:hypothetical protein
MCRLRLERADFRGGRESRFGTWGRE